MRKTLLIPAMCAALAAAGGALAHGERGQERTGADLLRAAERSFSATPFGAVEAPPDLVLVDPAQCETWGECYYRDADGVGHLFHGGELVVKWVEVAEVGDRPIAALGIGTARTMDAVLENVRRVLPEAEIACVRALFDLAGRDCSALLGEGWITLRFDGDGRLVEARVDALDFT